MSNVTRKKNGKSSPRQKYIAIASSINEVGEPYKPGQCAIAEHLHRTYPELHRIFVDEDGRISFTDTLSGNRYRWIVKSRDYRVWLVGFDKGHAPDWDLSVELDVRDASVTTPARRKELSDEARAYGVRRVAEGREPKPGTRHGKRAQRVTVKVEGGR